MALTTSTVTITGTQIAGTLTASAGLMYFAGKREREIINAAARGSRSR